MYVYDKFKAYQQLIDTIFARLGLTDIRVGDDFSHVYKQYVAPYRDAIVLNKCDILDIEWTGEPIKILFIDCAANPEVGHKIIKTFYPHLIPGLSLVIDQDFFFQPAWWLPYKTVIHGAALVPLYAEDCTLISQCVASFDLALLGSALSEVPIADRVTALESLAAGFPREQAQLVGIQIANLLIDDGRTNDTDAILAGIGNDPASAGVRMRLKKTNQRRMGSR